MCGHGSKEDGEEVEEMEREEQLVMVVKRVVGGDAGRAATAVEMPVMQIPVMQRPWEGEYAKSAWWKRHGNK